MFTHMAEYESSIVIPNALYHLPARANYSAACWCTYSDPEVARVGMTEAQAREAADKVQAYRYKLDMADRPVIDGDNYGLIKLVCRKKRLLGATIIARHAADLLHEYVMVMANKLPITAVSGSIHVYPAFGQVVRRAANLYYAENLFKGRLPGIMKKIFGLKGTLGGKQ